MTDAMSDPTRKIAACRKDLAALAAVWQEVAARSAPRAKAEAEAQVFNQLVVALDSQFGGVSGGAAAAAQEVRLLAQGVAANGGRFPADDVARWRPDASVTGYRVGDRIALSEELFSRLADVFLDGMAKRFAD